MAGILMLIDSTTIATTTTEDFTIGFNKPIELGSNLWEASMVKFNGWYSWYNISTELGNNTLEYYNGSTWNLVTFPDGQYSVDDINSYLHYVMKQNGDYTLSGTTEIYDIEILPNNPTGKVQFIFTGGYEIDLTTGDLYLLLGGTQSIYTISGDLENIANLINDINSVLIRCDLVAGAGSYINSVKQDILYSFVPNTIPGSNINIEPINRIYVPINTTDNKITEIRMYITDNLNRPINLEQQPVTYLLHFRPVNIPS